LPVSDPNIFSVAQRITMAQTQLQLAQSAPQMHNMYEAYRRMYEAVGVRDIDQILNSQNVDKPKDPASENAQALDGSPLKAFAGQQHDAHILTHILFGMSPMMQSMPNVAVNLQKHIFDHIRLKAEEDTEVELFQQYGTDPEKMVSALQREAMIATKVAKGFQEVKKLQEDMAGNQEDPLVGLKKQELQQSGERDKAKTAVDQAKLQLDQQKEQADQQESQSKLMLEVQKFQQEQQRHATDTSFNAHKHHVDTQFGAHKHQIDSSMTSQKNNADALIKMQQQQQQGAQNAEQT
jgi:hypothetical protein